MKQTSSLSQELKMQQRLSQTQVRFVRMLELNAPEFDEAVASELEANPALEAEETDTSTDVSEPESGQDYRSYRFAGGHKDYDFYAPADMSDSIYDSLESQLGHLHLDPETDTVARFIIGNLDSNGYMTRSPELISGDMLIRDGVEPSSRAVTAAVEAVRSLDPAGVGAYDLRDCLLLQVLRLPQGNVRDNAIVVLRDYFDEFSLRHFSKIESAAGITSGELDEALALIRSLDPKPGAALGPASPESFVAPDFILEPQDGKLVLSLGNRIPELSIDKGFEQVLSGSSSTVNEADREYVQSRQTEAREFIGIVKRRQSTLYKVMQAIMRYQREYFLTEDPAALRPMALKDVASLAGIDIPTASRATNNKYISTPWGVFPLRYFFSEKFEAGGDSVSGRGVEALLREIVASEDKRRPMSDDAIASRMREQGYEVSRRTVSKYRDRLGIPVARLRRSR